MSNHDSPSSHLEWSSSSCCRERSTALLPQCLCGPCREWWSVGASHAPVGSTAPSRSAQRFCAWTDLEWCPEKTCSEEHEKLIMNCEKPPSSQKMKTLVTTKAFMHAVVIPILSIYKYNHFFSFHITYSSKRWFTRGNLTISIKKIQGADVTTSTERS